MKLDLTEEQQMLCDSVSKLFMAESSTVRVRKAEGTGFDEALWRQLVQMGIVAMRVPQPDGDSMSLFDAVLIAEIAGRHLASLPLAETVPALGLLAKLPGRAAKRLLEGAVLEGAEQAAVVVILPTELRRNALHMVSTIPGAITLALCGDTIVAMSTSATESGDHPSPGANLGSEALSARVVWVDAGIKKTVADDNTAEDTAVDKEGIDSAAVKRGVINPGGNCEVIASGDVACAHFRAAIEEWKLLKAAMLVGLSRQAVALAADYATEREQFGKPIGAYQGIAHPLADALTDIDGARLLVWRAVWAIAQRHQEAAAYVSMAWWWATQSSARAVSKSLHTFGGYGVSLEYDIQLYYRRAKSWALLAGDPQRELYTIADRLWGDASAPSAHRRQRQRDSQTPQQVDNPSESPQRDSQRHQAKASPNARSPVSLPDAGAVSVAFEVGAAARAFGEQVRAFFETHMTAELKAHAHHSVAGYHAGFHKTLAAAGLLYPHWPTEFGGSGKTAFDMAAAAEVFEDFNWQRITVPVTNQVAQVIMRFGSADVQREVLPRFASGDAIACLGFTEPSSGSDVFAAKTRAVRIGDDWQIDGQKVFTTAANLADYIFLLVRTAPDLPKHKGLTLFLVPMHLPGVSIDAIHTLQDERTNITYLSAVRVPDRYRLGAVNGGLAVMAATLEIEHGGDQYRLSFESMVRHAVRWAQTDSDEQGSTEKRPMDNPEVRRRLARAMVHTTIARDLCYRAIWAVEQGIPNRAAFGPMSKVFSTETYQADAADLMDLTAPLSLFAGREGLGHIEIGYRQSIGMTIYGGSSEIHRSLIAEQGLNMPRSRT